VCAFLLLLVPGVFAGEEVGFTDVVGREISIFNDLINPAFPTDTVSREFSLFNDLINPAEPTDALSREVAVMKYTAVVTSNATARALPLDPDLVLPDQLAALNMPPPLFDPLLWRSVHRKNVNSAALFECDASPDPLAEGYVFADEYLNDVDEVTFDNCGSAWYRFTLVLPQDASDATMIGLTNVTQQGVLYVNGNQISGTMSVPPCVPQSGPDDPCYDAQDTGSDGDDASGRAILTSPTPDIFQVDDSSLFAPGLNELVFGVAGDASFFDPTGLEFEAFLFFSGAIACPGDLDGNAVVDLADFELFASCFAGVDVPISEECAFSDLDADGDADLHDFAVFQVQFGEACP
jgi:hypothetical protein